MILYLRCLHISETCALFGKRTLGARRFQRAVSARRNIASQSTSCRDCAQEGTRTQAGGNRSVGCNDSLFALPSHIRNLRINWEANPGCASLPAARLGEGEK